VGVCSLALPCGAQGLLMGLRVQLRVQLRVRRACVVQRA
jgi:hypothetical protein